MKIKRIKGISAKAIKDRDKWDHRLKNPKWRERHGFSRNREIEKRVNEQNS